MSFSGGYSFHEWSPTSTSYCFQVNLLCVNPFLSGGLVCVGTGWVVCFGGVWGSTCGGQNFCWICTLLIWNFTEHMSFLQAFFMHSVEVDYLPGCYVDQYPGGKGLIVSWRQILNCEMDRETVHMGERGRVYVCMCVSVCARGHAHLCACGCSHVLLHACVKNFNCTLTNACTSA